MVISGEDRERIAAAIEAAEAKTSGEIVCVLTRASCDAIGLPILLAAALALALPWLLIAVTEFTVTRILLLQILAFVLLVPVFCLPPVRVALLPRRARRRAAHRMALEQFRIHGLARKKERNGILIFVSLAERYVRIIADDAIVAHVRPVEWQAAVDALVSHMRQGKIADGFLAAIGACETVLAAHFPRKGASRDELPNKIFVI